MPLRQREKIQEVLRKTYRIVPAAIILFWLAMMGALIYREAFIPWMRAGVLPPRAMKMQDLWMGVYTAADRDALERVGFINARSLPDMRNGRSGLQLGVTARIEMSVLFRKTELVFTGRAWIDADHGLSDFDFSLRSGEYDMRIEGHVEDGMLRAVLHTAGESLPFDFPVSADLLLGGGFGFSALEAPLLEPGQEIYVDAFDPTRMSVGKARIICTGEEMIEIECQPIYALVIETTLAGMTTRAWVNRDGEVLRADTPFGFILKKTTPEAAMKPVEPTEAASLVRAYAMQPTGITPRRGIVYLRANFSGVAVEHLPPDDEIQFRTPDGWVIIAPEPPNGDPGAPLSAEEQKEYLAGDPFITVDHERIRDAMRLAAGDATEPWQKAISIYEWVYENMRKTPVISVPTALDVLRTMEGDCNEHAVLFTALARAAAIPARVVIGIAWSEKLEAFGYHAWPEVHIGRWIPMDPTLGQPIADATHIKLFHGGIDQWARLLPFIGQLQIEVLEIR